jgi:hypothetical protein
VADRENARVQVFPPGGPQGIGPNGAGAPLAVWQAPPERVTPYAALSPQELTQVTQTWLHHVSALCYEPFLDVVFVIEGADVVMRSLAGTELQRIGGGAADDGGALGPLLWPHDVEATAVVDEATGRPTAVAVYVAELKGNRVRRYTLALDAA